MRTIRSAKAFVRSRRSFSSLLLHVARRGIRQVLIDRLAHGAERGAAIPGECGEVLGHSGSNHVGDDTRCGWRARTLRREAVSCESA